MKFLIRVYLVRYFFIYIPKTIMGACCCLEWRFQCYSEQDDVETAFGGSAEVAVVAGDADYEIKKLSEYLVLHETAGTASKSSLGLEDMESNPSFGLDDWKSQKDIVIKKNFGSDC